MALPPQFVGIFAPTSDFQNKCGDPQPFDHWWSYTSKDIDRMIAYSTGPILALGETRLAYVHTLLAPGRPLTPEENQYIFDLYRIAGWADVRLTAGTMCGEIHTVILQLFPPEPDDDGMHRLWCELRDFVAGRPVKVLTRKANSKADSGVSYSRVVEGRVDAGSIHLFVRVTPTEAVGAASVRPQITLLKKRSGDAAAWPSFEQELS